MKLDHAGKPFSFSTMVNGVLMDGVTAMKLLKLQEENERLRKENEKLRKEIADISKDDEAFIFPYFPDDFDFYGSEGVGDSLNECEIQDIIIEAHKNAQDLEDGQFTFVSTKNTAVIVLRCDDKLITVVAKDFFENELEIEFDDSEDGE